MSRQIELINSIEETKVWLRQEGEGVHSIIQIIKAKRIEANELRDKRDKVNSAVKELAQAGRDQLGKKAEVDKKADELIKLRRKLLTYVREKAEEMKLTKVERNRLNSLAGDKADRLQAQLEQAVIMLFDYNLSLKDEVVLFEMVFDLMDRLSLREDATQVNEVLGAKYHELKQSAEQADKLYDEIGQMRMQGQQVFQEVAQVYAQRDKRREEADTLHQSLLGIYKEIKGIEKEIDARNKNRDKLKRSIDDQYKELRSITRSYRDMEEAKKVAQVKKKAQSKGKLGMEELKLLLDKGELDF